MRGEWGCSEGSALVALSESGNLGERNAERCGDQAVLGLLLTDSAAIWSVEEMASEIGNNPIHVTDSINRLARAGLVHRLDGFVFATRAAKETELALA